MKKIKLFNDRAFECREQAHKAILPLHKENWLKLAVEWERIAKEAQSDPDAF